MLFCVIWFVVILLPSLAGPHCMPANIRREQQISQRLLKSIMAAWLDQQKTESRPSNLVFDKDAASKKLGRGASPWTDQDLVVRRREIQQSLEVGQIYALIFVPPLALVALLWRRNVRRAIAVPLSLLLLVGLVSLAARQLSTLFVPGTHAYLDDYDYLSNVDLLHPTGKIAAYDLPSSQQGRYQVVAFDDGRVEILGYDVAKPLFEQQGIPYPEPLPPP